MIINYRNLQDRTNDYNRLRIEDSNEAYFINSIIQKEGIAVLNTIEIETINRCNNDCSFCPVSKNNDIRTPARMTEELFKKIIGELEEMKYSGLISLFSNNEPLLDVRIFDWLDYVKEKLPYARRALFTNGILLNEEKYRRLVSSLDYLVIDNYNDEFVLNDNILELYNSDKVSDMNCKVNVWVRKKNQILDSRGGLAPNKEKIYKYHSACLLPFIQMIVRPDGKVSRCCQDAYGKDTLGDLNHQTIAEIWNGEEYEKLRRHILQKGRAEKEFCESCDLFGLTNHYPDDWRFWYGQQLFTLISAKKKEGRQIVLAECSTGGYLQKALAVYGIFVDKYITKKEIEQLSKSDYLILEQYQWDMIQALEEKNFVNIEDYIIFDLNKYLDRMLDYIRMPMDEHKKRVDMICKASEHGNLILFGSGNIARQMLESFHLRPARVVDNSVQKIGERWHGFVIEDASRLRKEDVEDKIILNATSDYAGVIEQLRRQGVDISKVVEGRYFT